MPAKGHSHAPPHVILLPEHGLSPSSGPPPGAGGPLNTPPGGAAPAVVPAVAEASTSSGLPRKDVDQLVQEIKENLKLGLGGHSTGAPSSNHPTSTLVPGPSLTLPSVASAPSALAGLGSGYASGPGLKSARLTHRGSHRASPYQVPPCSRAPCDNGPATPGGGQNGANSKAGGGPSQLRRWNQRRRYPSTCAAGSGKSGGVGADPDDPLEMLQELLTEGSLIKEAVRRLQLGLTPKLKAAAAAPAPYYDSDEECRTPPEAELEPHDDDHHHHAVAADCCADM